MGRYIEDDEHTKAQLDALIDARLAEHGLIDKPKDDEAEQPSEGEHVAH